MLHCFRGCLVSLRLRDITSKVTLSSWTHKKRKLGSVDIFPVIPAFAGIQGFRQEKTGLD